MREIGTVILVLTSFFAGILVSRHLAFKRIVSGSNTISKYMCLFKFSNKWISLKQKETDIVAYFKDRGYYSIAIYGMGDLGERLVDEVENTDVNIAYAIDRSRKGQYANIQIKSLEEILPQVDAVIVTPIYDFWRIKPIIMDRIDCPIVSLEDVIYKYEKK